MSKQSQFCFYFLLNLKNQDPISSFSSSFSFYFILKVNCKVIFINLTFVYIHMAKVIVDLVNDAKVLNADVVTLPRILILAALKDLGEDGATFRELKATLDMSDGTLFSNLKALKKMGYVKESKVEVEDKEMHSFSITREGKEMFYAVCSWFNGLKE